MLGRILAAGAGGAKPGARGAAEAFERAASQLADEAAREEAVAGLRAFAMRGHWAANNSLWWEAVWNSEGGRCGVDPSKWAGLQVQRLSIRAACPRPRRALQRCP